MFAEIFFFLMVLSANAAHPDIERCQAYLLDKNQPQSTLRLYVNQAPLESEDLVRHLPATLYNLYLMRPGNELFAFRHLELFFKNYWDDYLKDRHTENSKDWMEQQTQFLERLGQMNPIALRDLWRLKFDEYAGQIVDLGRVISDFKDIDLLTDHDRFEYMRAIIVELNYHPFRDVESLSKLYVIGGDQFAGNAAFASDVRHWAGLALTKSESPLEPLIFMVRLSDRMKIFSPQLQTLDTHIRRVRTLLPRVPR